MTPSVENPKFIPVCLADNELFIVKTGEEFSNSYIVLRVVDKETLDWARSDEGIRERYKEIWQMAVERGLTEDSLTEYIESSVDIRDRDEDPEWLPDKDTYGYEVFEEYKELRDICDSRILADSDIEVGTWEGSGFYSYDPTELQIVFNPKYLK